MVRISGNFRVDRSVVGTNTVSISLPLPRTNSPTCMIGRAGRGGVVDRPLHRAELVEPRERDAGERRGGRRDLVHDLRRGGVRHVVAHRPADRAGDLPLVHADLRGEHRAHPVDPALGVGEGAVLLQERRAGQEDVGEAGGLVEEQVLDDDEVHRPQRRLDVLGVGVGLGDVLALDVEAAEGAGQRRVEHVGDPQARLGVEGQAPQVLVDRRGRRPARRAGSPGTRAGRSPCRRSPGRCSARAAG